jgi:hypothetical protein
MDGHSFVSCGSASPVQKPGKNFVIKTLTDMLAARLCLALFGI